MLNTVPTEDTAMSCPNCGVAIPVHKGYTSWCDKCGWNLKPEDLPPTRNILTILYRGLNARNSRSLLERLSKSKARSLQPTLTPRKVLAYALATWISGFSVLLAVAALLALVFWRLSPFACLIVPVLVLIAFAMRPRIVKFDP